MEVGCVALAKKRPRWIHGLVQYPWLDSSLTAVLSTAHTTPVWARTQEPSSAYYILTNLHPSMLPTRQSYARCRNVAGTKRVDNRTQCDATVRMACVPEFRTATLVSRRVTFTSDTADHPDPTADAAPILCCDALTFTTQQIFILESSFNRAFVNRLCFRRLDGKLHLLYLSIWLYFSLFLNRFLLMLVYQVVFLLTRNDSAIIPGVPKVLFFSHFTQRGDVSWWKS